MSDLSNFFPPAELYDPANPAPPIDCGNETANYGGTPQDSAALVAGLSPQELIRAYNAATDAAGADYPAGTLGNHAIGSAVRRIRYFLGLMANLNMQLSAVDFQVFVESPEGLQQLTNIAALIETLPQPLLELAEATKDLQHRSVSGAGLVANLLQQRQWAAEQQQKHLAELEAEAKRLQAEVEAAEQKELSRLERLLKKMGIVTTKGEK